MNPDPDPGSGSAFSFYVGSGSGSAKKRCGSETLLVALVFIPEFRVCFNSKQRSLLYQGTVCGFSYLKKAFSHVVLRVVRFLQKSTENNF
jgi:hypothetical protein